MRVVRLYWLLVDVIGFHVLIMEFNRALYRCLPLNQPGYIVLQMSVEDVLLNRMDDINWGLDLCYQWAFP